MRCAGGAALCVDGGADGLQREEDGHARDRGQEECPTAESLDREGAEASPEKAPHLENGVDEKLFGNHSEFVLRDEG